LPAGSIFCNNDIIPTADSGICHFICIPGFVNTDRFSYNGCESARLAPNHYRFIFPNPIGDIPAVYGGYMIGDYEVEYYMAWLNTAARALPITLPTNVQLFNYQLSAFLIPAIGWPTITLVPPATPNLMALLWY
jgi:hypothetical protein